MTTQALKQWFIDGARRAHRLELNFIQCLILQIHYNINININDYRRRYESS